MTASSYDLISTRCYNQHKLSELESLVKEASLAQEWRDQGYIVLGSIEPSTHSR